MVAPEEGVPGVFGLHAFLPCLEQGTQLGVVRCLQGPFLAVLVVDLQVMEGEDHLQFLLGRIGVTDTVVQRGRGHLTDGHIARDAACLDQLLQILMDLGAIGVEAPAVALMIVFIDERLGDQVDHVKTETGNAFLFPETQDFGQLFTDSGILPVQVRLRHIKEMQVILAQGRDIFPGVSAEFGFPVGRRVAVHRIFEDIVVHIDGIACQGFLEPFMVGGSMVEDHIEHEADAAVGSFLDQGVGVVHGTEHGIDAVIIGYIIAVVIHGGQEERGDPQIIHPEIFQVVQAAADSVQVADAVAVGIAEGFDINLVYGAVSEIRHGDPPYRFLHILYAIAAGFGRGGSQNLLLNLHFLLIRGGLFDASCAAEDCGQNERNNNRDGHGNCEEEHLVRTDGQNAGQTADADGKSFYTGQYGEYGCAGRAGHGTDEREYILQVDTEDSGLCNTQVTGDAGGNVDFLRFFVLSLQSDHSQNRGTLRDVGKSDHGPEHGAAELSDQLQVDGVGHMVQTGDDQRRVNETEDGAEEDLGGTSDTGVNNCGDHGTDLPADGAQYEVSGHYSECD